MRGVVGASSIPPGATLRGELSAPSFHAPSQTPHAITDRLTFTIPAGRRAYILGGTAVAVRATAATVSGRVYLEVRFGALRLMAASKPAIAVGEEVALVLPGGLVLAPTTDTALVVATRDDSVGGGVDYSGIITLLLV